MKVAILVTVAPTGYSGGRYASLMMAIALACRGHEVHFITNNKPAFFIDLEVFPSLRDVRLTLTPDFVENLPGQHFDLSIIVPGSRNHDAFYLQARLFSLHHADHICLLNFESGNWFNSLSPVPRDLGHWAPWIDISREASLILSISEEGSRFAREFYYPANGAKYAAFHPPINTRAADSVGDVASENRILLMARFTMGEHKGGFEIARLLCEAMGGHTLVILIGTGDIPKDLMEQLIERAKQFDIQIELKYGLSDREKFTEIKRSRLMLFPSYFEGYGLPPIESLYCDRPVIAFDLPVLRETCGDLITYARHGDFEDMRTRIEATLRRNTPAAGLADRLGDMGSVEHAATQLEVALGQLSGVAPLDGEKRHRCIRALRQQEKRAQRQDDRVRRSHEIKMALIKPIARVARWLRNRTRLQHSVCYWPPFPDRESLTNHYYRAAWYLPQVDGKLEHVDFYSIDPSGDLRPLGRPGAMCTWTRGTSHLRVHLGRLGCMLAALRASVVLSWHGYERDPYRKFLTMLGIRVVNIDTEDLASREYGAYCSLIWKHLTPERERMLELHANHEMFHELAWRIRRTGYKRALACGTGPSLEQIYDFDLKDTLTIVCNSTVQSPELLDHLRPTFICAGDAISHFGVSRYAEQFRTDLIKALHERDLYYVGTASIGYLLGLNHPEIKDRMILIEQTKDDPVYDFTRQFGSPKLDSTLNIHMLPLAATFCDDIWVIGCDGKSTKRSNEDFWAHAKQAQYHDLVETGHICHPTFDVHRQKSTYQRFIRSTEQTVLRGEREHGKSYRSLAPSNIPVLTPRSLPEDWRDRMGGLSPCPLNALDELLRPARRNVVDAPDGDAAPPVDPTLPSRLAVSMCEIDAEGVLTIRGWVISPRRIGQIRIKNGVHDIGQIVHYMRRPDIEKKFPEYHASDNGFIYMKRCCEVTEQTEAITLIAYDEAGEVLAEAQGKIRPVARA